MVRAWLSVNLNRHGVDCEGDRRAHRSLDTRGPVSNVAAFWPQFGYRGANPFNVARRAREKSLATELGFEGHMKWAEATP